MRLLECYQPLTLKKKILDVCVNILGIKYLSYSELQKMVPGLNALLREKYQGTIVDSLSVRLIDNKTLFIEARKRFIRYFFTVSFDDIEKELIFNSATAS